MEDLKAQLERLRTDAEDCALISKLAANRQKREMFARLAAQLRQMAIDVENEIKASAGALDKKETGAR